MTKAAAAVGILSYPDMAAEIEKARPKEDTQHLAEQEKRREMIAKIERAAAQMHHDIDDLTLETIDTWKMTPFPN